MCDVISVNIITVTEYLNVEADLLYFTKRVTKAGGSEIRGNDMHWTVSPLEWGIIEL